jgi:hypothetical protein
VSAYAQLLASQSTANLRAAAAGAPPPASSINWLSIFAPIIPLVVLGVLIMIAIIWFLNSPLGQALTNAVGALSGVLTAGAAWVENCLGTWWCPLLMGVLALGALFGIKQWTSAREAGNKLAREQKNVDNKEKANAQAEESGNDRPFTDEEIAQDRATIVPDTATINNTLNKVQPEVQQELATTATEPARASQTVANDAVNNGDPTEDQETAIEESNTDAQFEDAAYYNAGEMEDAKVPVPQQLLVLRRMSATKQQLLHKNPAYNPQQLSVRQFYSNWRKFAY